MSVAKHQACFTMKLQGGDVQSFCCDLQHTVMR